MLNIKGRSLYECLSEGNVRSLEMFRWYFLFSSCLCIMHTKVHKCSTALFTVVTKETLYQWANSKWIFCALEGHFGKGTPFVGTFQTKVSNLVPSRSPSAKGTCDGHVTQVISVCDHVIFI